MQRTISRLTLGLILACGLLAPAGMAQTPPAAGVAAAPGGALTSTPPMLNQCSKVVASGRSASATWSPWTR